MFHHVQRQIHLILTGFENADNLLCAWDCFPQPADVRLSYELQGLHDIPKVVCLSERQLCINIKSLMTLSCTDICQTQNSSIE